MVRDSEGADVRHVIRHDLDDDLARRTANAAIEYYRSRYARYSPRVTWVDDKRARIEFVARHIRLEVGVALSPGAIEIEMEVPFLLRVFRQKAIDRVEADVAGWLQRARAGEF